MLASLFGRFSQGNVFPESKLTLFAAIGMFGLIALILILITFTRRWKWLWREWLTTTNHKKIGVMYIIVAILMLLRGASDAAMMRGQQATSVGAHHGFMSASMFQQVVSAHGTIMIFFAAMGLMFGLINLVLPLQIGTRDVAFPFVNATSFWLFAAGALLINVSLGLGDFSGAGWLAYPPLSELRYSPSTGVDYWIWSLQIAGIGSLMSGINFITTIMKERARGMSLMKMPLFSWSVLGSMLLVAFAFPILTVTLTLLALDRTLGMHFFTAGGGGNAMMYVNLIWAWGHPEVYILVLPAFGIFSEVVSTFSSKRLFGYKSMVWAIMAITVLSYSVWLHHFFTMGAGADVNAVFGIATMLIAIPTGVKIFNWLFTMYRGRIRFSASMIWFMGFVFLFTMGGVAGVLLAVPAIDFQLHNSLFLVAHFHTMIVSGVLFGYFAGLTYWFPKVFGFRLNERLGKIAAYCWIFGFIFAFGPLYILGLMGATRRLDHYNASTGWQAMFIVAAFGGVIIACGIAVQIFQVIYSFLKRDSTRDLTGDPWNARTLEWSTSSPAPFYNFAVLPIVSTRDAFWDMKHSKKRSVKPELEPIYLPKNTPAGLFIASFAFLFGFGMIWHIWWLVGFGILGIILTILIRTTSGEHEEKITVAQLEAVEAGLTNWRDYA
ncbi:MAG TPA: cbb3-type cytochrome c oxidase subunit I [Candidatus Saccharimonadales bacterium]|nr:cbb3-type cytochrome c oxidase subunit I [Candidatus Saccharimonadales bacterium]